MIPPNIPIQNFQNETKWLLTGVSNGIDLKRMSTAEGRRDFPPGVSGSQMAWENDTCFLEVPFDKDSPPDYTYLLTFRAELKLADLRAVGDAGFSGNYYGKDHEFSQNLFIENAPEYTEAGCHGLLRYSAAALKQDDSRKEVLSLFPPALERLVLVKVEPIGRNSPSVPISFFDGESGFTDQFYTD